jgi:hypothetical protein
MAIIPSIPLANAFTTFEKSNLNLPSGFLSIHCLIAPANSGSTPLAIRSGNITRFL